MRDSTRLLIVSCCVVCLLTGCRDHSSVAAPGGTENTTSSAPLESAAVEPAAVVSMENSVLTAEEREYLWECEHGGNRLGQHGFSALSQAIVQENRELLLQALADDFRAAVPAGELQPRWEDAAVHVAAVKVDAASDRSARRPLAASEFVDWLLEVTRGPAASGGSAGFELLSYAPAERLQLSGPWQGHCRVRVESTVDGLQPQQVVIRFHMQTLAPLAENLSRGGWLTEWTVDEVEIRRSPQFLMQEVANQRGLSTDDLFDNWKAEQADRLVTVGGVYLCDFNRDGFTDVLVTAEKVAHNPRFYQGLPDGQFKDVTYRVGLPDVPGATRAVFADIDNDGWEDLVFLGRGLFLNRQGKVFQNATLSSNLTQLVLDKGELGVTGAAVADFDRDGLIDLYVTRADTIEHKAGSWIDGKSGNVRGNQLLRNVGRGQFEDVTTLSGTAGGRRSAFTASWLDANSDGWPDLYVIHEFGAGALLVNQQDGTFGERQLADASQDFGSMGLAVGDVDNDSVIDIYVSNMYSKAGNRVMDNLASDSFDAETMAKLRRMVSGSELHVGRGDLSYDSIGSQVGVANVGWSWGAALVDLNNDGWLDIHSTCGFMSYDRHKPDG